jgi:hypothetical protein
MAKGAKNKAEPELLPVLIIPGFMSSGLEVQSENPNDPQHGKRVWLNLQSLGFHRLAKGGREKRDKDDLRSTTEEAALELEYQQQLANKSSWINCMSLSDDMCTEHPGCRVRSIPGLDGVDYLTDSKMTQLGSYVFGPLIIALKKLGYKEGKSLDASPYDWRLPPSVTEERDGYLTKTMNRIQEMVLQNGGTPVVLLCHSMGCKMGHYLLNFIHDHPHGGQIWLDRYIHTFVVVGAPHLGVSKSIRASVTGDKMTLDAFLSDEDGLQLGRSLGSVPWMMPSALPVGNPAVLPTVIRRREGLLEIHFESEIDCSTLLKRRAIGYGPAVLRLCVVYGKETAITDFKIPVNGRLRFNERFLFSAPASLDQSHGQLEKMQFLLQEPGTHTVKEKKSFLRRLICCPFKWCICCPCSMVYEILKIPIKGTLILSDQVMAALGSATISASTGKMKLNLASSSQSKEPSEMSFSAHFYFRQDKPSSFWGARYMAANVRIRHSQAETTSAYRSPATCDVATLPPLQESTVGNNVASLLPFRLYHRKGEDFDPASGLDMMYDEGLTNNIQLIHDRYEKDPLGLGPRSRSASEAPPVRRVHAIYGVNVPTEVSAVYRRRPATVDEGAGGRLKSKFVLDPSATFDRVWRIGANSLSVIPYELKGGIVYETPYTPQRITPSLDGKASKPSWDTKQCCGDGTVPYWNLQHCETWRNKCEVSVNEIEGAEHREILADPRLHDILKKMLTQGADKKGAGPDPQNPAVLY